MSAYELAFQIILHAGNSKSHAMLAIEAAREGNEEKYKECMAVVSEEMINAHHVQSDMLHKEANGEKTDMNIIMVHAQDHLMMALLMREIAEEMNLMYARIRQLESKELTI